MVERIIGLVAIRLFASLAVAVVLILLFVAFDEPCHDVRSWLERCSSRLGGPLRPNIAPRPLVIGWIFAAFLFTVW